MAGKTFDNDAEEFGAIQMLYWVEWFIANVNKREWTREELLVLLNSFKSDCFDAEYIEEFEQLPN